MSSGRSFSSRHEAPPSRSHQQYRLSSGAPRPDHHGGHESAANLGRSREVVAEDWRAAGLLKPSVLKPVLTTIDPTLILKKLGRLTASDQVHLRQALAQILG